MDAALLNRIKATLEKHSPEQIKYDCPKCEDRGYIFKIQDGYEVAVPCECLEKKQSVEKMARSGLTEAFKQRTFKTFIVNNEWQLEAKAKAMDYSKNFKETKASLMLSGQPGSGKTHIGVATMLRLIENNTGCVYREYISMLTDLKQTSMDEEEYIRSLEKYINPPVLFLDDFLKGEPTIADRKHVYKIINTRYLKSMPMIISTEKSVKEILNWDEAIGSRIIEMCQGNVIEFPRGLENNYRLRGVI
ncbi:ATP-binding protein [Intestinibacter bartlettii]|uniref:ATP-binding protein n=1 Tax=Intestinibacter bartlettii TaxID=261299 RepID=UPI003AB5C5C4